MNFSDIILALLNILTIILNGLNHLSGHLALCLIYLLKYYISYFLLSTFIINQFVITEQKSIRFKSLIKMQGQEQKAHKHQKGKNCDCDHDEEQQLQKQLDEKLNIKESNVEPQPNQHPHYSQQQNEQDQQQPQQTQQQDQASSQQQQQGTNSKWKKIQQPQKTVKLFMIDFAHCDAKKCSGKKLQRFKLLTTLDKKKKFKGVVLSAFGKKECSLEDLQYAQKYGVCVVDCSWNRIQETREFRFKHQRKLPFVTAGNPVNYGKPYQLSCAEALATALCTIGYNDQAQYIMSKFGWSDGFWSLNPLIENYSKCKTLEQLKKQSKAIEQKGTQKFQRNYDLSDPESSGQEN